MPCCKKNPDFYTQKKKKKKKFGVLGDWTRAYWVRDSYGCLRTTEIQEIGAKKFPYSLLMKIASKSKFVVASTNPTTVQKYLPSKATLKTHKP